MNQAVIIKVLRNDSDADNDILSIKSFTQGANGKVSQDIWGKLTYTPNAGFYGHDSFTYKILDGNGGFDTATVSVKIIKDQVDDTPKNVAPVAVNDQANTESAQAVSIDVLKNDSDADGDNLKITSFTQPANGSVIIANGKMLYKSDDKFSGTDTFEYTISDGNGHTTTATVTINVGNGCNTNCPDDPTDPTNGTKATIDSATTNVGESVSIMVLANDAGTGLKIGDIDSPSNGTTVRVGNSIKYTPSAGFTGTDSFWYQIIDSKGYKDSAEVTVVVSGNGDGGDDGDGRNDTTPEANNDTASTTENTAVSIDVLANDSAGLTISSVTASANSHTEIVSGQLSYLPNDGFSGTDTITYTVTDANGKTAQATVRITVIADTTPPPSTPNRAPDAVEDAPTTGKDTAITVDVLANDTDPDGDALTITNVTQPQAGSATIVNNKVVYTPNGTVGSMSMTYTISDGHGHTDQTVLTIAVTDPSDGNNAFPVIRDENVTVRQGESILIDVLANDTDADGDTLVLDDVDQGGKGITEKVNGQVRYTPILDALGIDTFFYGVHDGHGHNGSGKVTVTIIR